MACIIFGTLHVFGLEVVLQPPEERTRVTHCATLVGKFVTWHAAAGTGNEAFA